MKTFNFRSCIARSALVLGVCMGIAHAEPSALVDTRAFDLRKPQDVAALYSRIEHKAADVCARAASPWDVGRVTFIKKCTEAAVEDAVARANVGALTALHKAKMGADPKLAQNRD